MDISCFTCSDDFKLFTAVINQGIDSHLEGFTKSKFEINKDEKRLFMDFHKTEIHILLRRLRAMGSEHADMWADDIENIE